MSWTALTKMAATKALIHRRFLWVFFQIEEICSQTSDDEIRQKIRTLPKDLLETFRRALQKIIANQKADVAAKMFRWVAAAKHPMSLLEIREAIAIKPCEKDLRIGQLVNDIDQMVSWCEDLLVLDEEEHLLQFAHTRR